MMKIVINKCFGGFGLSYKAVMRYAELKGFVLYPFVGEYNIDRTLGFRYCIPYVGEPNVAELIILHYSKEPLDPKGSYIEDNYFTVYDIERNDPLLVQVVEELGAESNGHCAALAVVEIPDGIRWVIEDRSGFEHIAEVPRTWG